MKTKMYTWLAGCLLAAGALRPQALLAQAPAGCTSTYTATGTASGGAAGLFAQYYPGTFQTQSGFSESSPVTFFSTTTPGQSEVDPLLNYQSPAATGYTVFPVAMPPATNNGGTPITFSARYRGSIYLKTGAAYTFTLGADDGAYLFLGSEATSSTPTPNNAFIKNGGAAHNYATVSRQFTAPSTGLYDIQVLFGQQNGGAQLRFDYAGGPDNLAQQRVPQSALCAGPSGINYASNQAPSANDATNATVYSNGTTAALSPGPSGFDQDGSIASYTIVTVPNSPSQGTLVYNNSATATANYVAVMAGQVITAANLGRLAYTSPSTNATAGTFTFTYTVADNAGATSANTATYSLPVAAGQLDLATTLSSPGTAPQGSLVYFTANITNNGPAPSANTITSIQLPAGLTGISLSNSGTYNSSTGLASYPGFALNAGATTTRSIAFTMPGSVVSGTANAYYQGFTDTNAGNDKGTATTSPTQVADIVVAITGPVRAVTQQSITYTVVSTNQGPSTAVGVKPAAKLPTGLVGVVVSDGGSYNATNGVVTWPAVSTLATGSFLAYTIKFAAPAATGSISASGSATSTTANGDPAPTNNDGTNGTATITTQIIGSAASTTTCIDPEATDPGYVPSPNTYYPGVSASGTTIVVGAALNNTVAGTNGSQKPLTSGDLLLVIQMQGAALNTTDTDAYGDGVDNNSSATGNLQDASFTAGQYEYALVQSVSGSTVTIKSALINSYVSSDATATQGQMRFQVIRVPRNADLTLTADIAGPRWNGRTGGVVALEVSGTLDLNGKKIDMAGRGFRGGAGQSLNGASGITTTSYRHSNTLATSANKGEGTAGTPRYLNDADNFAAYRASPTTTTTPFLDTQASGLLPGSVSDGYPSGDRARGAPGNAGGGGTDGNPGTNDQNSGGGGGGNAGRGGKGGNGWSSNSPSGGYGGADFTQATPSRIVMGGGGGAGTTNNGTVAATSTYPANAGIPAAGSKNAAGVGTDGFASSGAAGGGLVFIHAAKVSANAGTIDVSGADMNYVALNDGTGGGGAGGSVVLLVNASNGNANSPILQNIKVLANGGKGGSNTGGGSPHGPGGGGAGGLIFSSSVLNSATASAPAGNGTTYGFETYGSGVGAADNGQAQSGITRADVPNQIGSCPADVVTTLTTNYTQVAPGTTVTFTETTVNNGPGTATNVVSTLQVAPNLPASAFTNLAGGTYNATTGLITFPAVASLPTSSQNVYAVKFTMPSQTVTGQAASTASNDLDPRTANNDGSDPTANVKVVPLFDIAGRVFDDVNYGGGSGRNYSTAEASAQSSGVPVGTGGSATGSAGTTVELYSNIGNLVASTTTGPDGLYGFVNVASSGNGVNFTVRVVTSTVQSARKRSATGLLPVQTFRTSGGAADTERVGGEAPNLLDVSANVGIPLLSALGVVGTSQAQSLASVKLSVGQLTGVDFGYNFSTVTNTRDSGAGSLRQFILNANALPNTTLDQAASSNGGPDPAAGVETSIFMIADGKAHNGLAAGLANQLSSGGVASIVLNPASGTLPALSEASTTISGLTQTLNVGTTNTAADLGTGGTVGGALGLTPTLDKVPSPEVQLVGTPGQAGSEYGLTLAAGSQTITGLAIYGFGKTAGSTSGGDIYVTGNALTGTVIQGNVLGAAATSWADPGAATRSPGSGIVLANFSSNNVGGVSASISNNLIGFHGGSGIEDLASGSPGGTIAAPGTFRITDNEVRGNGQSNSLAAGLHLGNYGGYVYGNLAAGNQGTGIDLAGSTSSATLYGNTVASNGAGGAATAGIRFDGAGNLLQQNVVYSNAGAGILGMATGSVTTLTKNNTYSNGTLGIDLMSSTDNQATGTAGYVTRNDNGDPDTGANTLLNFPMLYEAMTYNGNLYISGYAPSKSTIELFIADPSAGQFGQGKIYLTSRNEGSTTSGQVDMLTGTGSYGGTTASPILINGMNQGNEANANQFEFIIPLSSFSTGFQNTLTSGTAYLTATATSVSGSNASTSEFSGTVLLKKTTQPQPLPVELTTFVAQARTPDAALTWTTAQEHNSDYYAVERSLDGQSFSEVGRVAAAGTSAGTRSYQFVDRNAAQLAGGQPVYYRLRQVDFDGTAALTSVRAVRFGGAAGLSVYPSPTSANATLDLTALPSGSYHVRVLDAVGRLVYDAPAAGAAPLVLPASTWMQGVYLVQVNGPNGSQTLRLTRE